MKLMADVIDRAINNHLWDGCPNQDGGYGYEFSCPAILAANIRAHIEANNRSKSPVKEKILFARFGSSAKELMDFLRSMGVCTDSKTEFDTILCGPKRQYARALWLTWAAMIAREEGKML